MKHTPVVIRANGTIQIRCGNKACAWPGSPVRRYEKTAEADFARHVDYAEATEPKS